MGRREEGVGVGSGAKMHNSKQSSELLHSWLEHIHSEHIHSAEIDRIGLQHNIVPSRSIVSHHSNLLLELAQVVPGPV